MAGGAARLLAGTVLAIGPIVGVPLARAESPPLSSIRPDSYPDTPAGIKVGNLLYHASVASGFAWDSNIFSSRENVIGDRIQFIQPGLTISTLDPNAKFTFQASLQHLEYDKAADETRTNARAALTGTVRLQRDTWVDLSLRADRVHDDRSLQHRDIPDDAAEPVLHNDYAASIALRRDFNPLISTTTASYENNDYFNVRSNAGPSINLQFLDRDIFTATHNLELRLSHRLSLFSRQAVAGSIYRKVTGVDPRDSVKLTVVNGIEVAFTPLIKARFSFHYAQESFDSPAYEAEPERIYTAEVIWSPRRHVRVTASFARDFGGINFDLDAAGGQRTRAGLGLEYDISRQLLFRTSVRYQHANEAGITAAGNRVEDTYEYKASLGYQASRYWNLSLDYAYEARRARDYFAEFDRHVVQAAATARF
jgi:hypothetical protein